jgi:hypothetical protein
MSRAASFIIRVARKGARMTGAGEPSMPVAQERAQWLRRLLKAPAQQR